MSTDFDTIIDRRGTNSIKYDFARERGKPQDALPMWVADMDFPAPTEVLTDLQKAVAHGIFGYSEPKEAYYRAVSEWFAASKTFNLAGLQVSNIFVINEELRNRLQAEIHRSGYSQLNTFGIVACPRVIPVEVPESIEKEFA